eukprot:6179854-Pleurochrysis_carterae.AAC.3
MSGCFHDCPSRLSCASYPRHPRHVRLISWPLVSESRARSARTLPFCACGEGILRVSRGSCKQQRGRGRRVPPFSDLLHTQAAVVGGALVGIGEHVVGVAQSLEAFGRLLGVDAVARRRVGVVAQRQQAELLPVQAAAAASSARCER